MTDQAHIALMAAVAKHFFGEPNRQQSKNGELRFGTNGSKSVDLEKGVWFDHEAGKGGGPLDLIMRETGLTTARECYTWAQREGYWSNGKADNRKQAAVYDYIDEAGALLFQKIRYEPKDFRLRKPDGNGGWTWKLGDARRVLYRLPETIETIANDRLILVVEGEKDVDSCWRIGVPATCNEGGANKWRGDLTPVFKGADVVIVGDNDEPGREHVVDVASKLSHVARRVRVLDLAKVWPQCPPKGDISNWIEVGGTAEQIYALIEPLPDWQRASALGDFDVGELFETGYMPSPRQWLLGNQFCLGFISTLFAGGGVGKSALRLLQFISLAIGRSLCEQHVFRRCRVLIISLEDNKEEVMRRIIAVVQKYEIDPAELKGWLRVACPIGMRLATQGAHRGERTTGPLQEAMLEAVHRFKPDVIGIDPFVKTHELDENTSGDMNYVCDLLTKIAVDRQVAVDIPHHVHKGRIEPGDADAGRGSSAVKDAGRLNYTLTVMDEAEAKAFDINPDDRFAYVRLDSAKVNITGRSGKPEWFQIIGKKIGNTTETYPAGDEIQVVEPWKPPETSAWKGLSYACLNKALDRIAEGVVDDKGLTGERYRAAPQATHAAWKAVQVIVNMEANKSDADCKAMVKAWLKSGTLVERDYTDRQRKVVKGLYVDNSKRPGKTVTEDTDEPPASSPPAGEPAAEKSPSTYRSWSFVGDCPQSWVCTACGVDGHGEKGKVAKYKPNQPGARATVLHEGCAESWFERH